MKIHDNTEHMRELEDKDFGLFITELKAFLDAKLIELPEQGVLDFSFGFPSSGSSNDYIYGQKRFQEIQQAHPTLDFEVVVSQDAGGIYWASVFIQTKERIAAREAARREEFNKYPRIKRSWLSRMIERIILKIP